MMVGNFAKIESFSIHELIFSVFHNGFEFPKKINFLKDNFLSTFSAGQFCVIVIYKFDAFWHVQVGFLSQAFNINKLSVTM